MVSTYTTNIQAEQPARGDQTNTWATNPCNNNSALFDLVSGGNISVSLSTVGALGIALLSSQYQCKRITFTGALAATFSVVLPSSFKKSWEIVNSVTNSSLFYFNLYTNQVGSAFIAPPPGETTDVISDGFDIKFKNLDRVGTFWDYGGSSVPLWLSGCGIAGVLVVPPYLNCDGSTFSSSTYPQLAAILGSTTLPDARGRVRAPTNQGTGRMSAVTGGVNGDVNFAAGGSENYALVAAHIPTLSFAGAFSANCSVADVVRASAGLAQDPRAHGGADTDQNFPGTGATAAQRTATATVSVVSNNTGGAAHFNAQPTYVGGLTLIRAG